MKEASLSKERELFELALIQEALAQKKPIFGVCRGMQLINVALGGSLYQELGHLYLGKNAHKQFPVAKESPTHEIQTKNGSILEKVYGKKTKVNSFHLQAVKRLAANLKITALSEDGVIEGIESCYTDQVILGVQ